MTREKHTQINYFSVNNYINGDVLHSEDKVFKNKMLVTEQTERFKCQFLVCKIMV